ncbi:hypothetical protein FIBSPDRAFT_894534 [Athelia psychrophila]|uniref:Uncharacterized protein n=1 Tax=Athelia psychrophila TaxID=1759441 RepID=A0A166FT57_9AGAM|nr:hypothetical protein FIBSPDRAFT_894534 [Fibularhizoctonia sp. CBS 109695]
MYCCTELRVDQDGGCDLASRSWGAAGRARQWLPIRTRYAHLERSCYWMPFNYMWTRLRQVPAAVALDGCGIPVNQTVKNGTREITRPEQFPAGSVQESSPAPNPAIGVHSKENLRYLCCWTLVAKAHATATGEGLEQWVGVEVGELWLSVICNSLVVHDRTHKSQGDMTPVLIARFSSTVLAFRRRFSIEPVYPSQWEEGNGEEYMDETEGPAPVQRSMLCQRGKKANRDFEFRDMRSFPEVEARGHHVIYFKNVISYDAEMAKRWLHWLRILRSQCGTVITRMRDCVRENSGMIALDFASRRREPMFERTASIRAFARIWGSGRKNISLIDVQVPGGSQDALEKKPRDLEGYDKIILGERVLQRVGTDQERSCAIVATFVCTYLDFKL